MGPADLLSLLPSNGRPALHFNPADDQRVGIFPGENKIQAPPPAGQEPPAETAPDAPPTREGVRSRSAALSMLKINFQMHLERSVRDPAGRQISETLDMKFELTEVRYEEALKNGKGKPYEEAPKEGDTEQTNPFLKKLLEYFNPENTAGRIADFVKSGFPRTSFGESNAPDSRRAFVDFIMPFIKQGFDEARSWFGELPEEVKKTADETFNRVTALLNDFAGSGSNDAAEAA